MTYVFGKKESTLFQVTEGKICEVINQSFNNQEGRYLLKDNEGNVFKSPDIFWNEVLNTTDYFNKGKEELSEKDEYGYTKEERLLFDDGLKVMFFHSLEHIQEIQPKFDIKAILMTIDKRYALVLI